jgi:hypothetical protein
LWSHLKRNQRTLQPLLIPTTSWPRPDRIILIRAEALAVAVPAEGDPVAAVRAVAALEWMEALAAAVLTAVLIVVRMPRLREGLTARRQECIPIVLAPGLFRVVCSSHSGVTLCPG